MAYKIEKWMSEVFPGRENIYSEYRNLGSRELAIVCSAVLDAALAELISLRLADVPKEAESFLGLNEDGRAPAGSMGARIQLAVLLNIITVEDAEILRTLKGVRNAFAHRVKLTFLSPKVQVHVRKLFNLLKTRNERMKRKGLVKGDITPLLQIEPLLSKQVEASEGLILAVLAIYQAFFHRIHGAVKRLDRAYPGGVQIPVVKRAEFN